MDKGGNPGSAPAASSTPEPNLERGAAQIAARAESAAGMDTTPRHEAPPEMSQSIADTASKTVPTGGEPGIAGSRASIVDSRDRIVLQSGPRMLSKNVAKINTGSVVQVISDEGKWVQVRTEEGQVGYVRRTQLEILQ